MYRHYILLCSTFVIAHTAMVVGHKQGKGKAGKAEQLYSALHGITTTLKRSSMV